MWVSTVKIRSCSSRAPAIRSGVEFCSDEQAVKTSRDKISARIFFSPPSQAIFKVKDTIFRGMFKNGIYPLFCARAGLEMPSFLILLCKVVGFSPRSAAAPCGP